VQGIRHIKRGTRKNIKNEFTGWWVNYLPWHLNRSGDGTHKMATANCFGQEENGAYSNYALILI